MALTNDLDVLEVLVVNNFVELRPLADARSLVESGFVVKGWQCGVRHTSRLSGEFGNEGGKEVRGGGAGGGELGFELVHHGH